MRKLSAFDWIALVLLIVGGLNWGLVGFFNFDLVGWLFGSASALSRVVYAVVGICALYTLVSAIRKGSRPAPGAGPAHGGGGGG